ncbi:hypothetical protein KC902_00115 [Candidatus Kaiserbacteria bacterium]|nr:hypothetical protein [Candidatus Kaiserbacteria bacterium]USN88668.1 MAG: hypothetical protein H6780_04240 [Candidatus Nomurabacteria bacterium]
MTVKVAVHKRSDPMYRATRKRLLRFIRKSNNCELVRQTTSSVDEVFWREFFIWVYGDTPKSATDPRWDELFHEHGAMQAFGRITAALERKHGSPLLSPLLDVA